MQRKSTCILAVFLACCLTTQGGLSAVLLSIEISPIPIQVAPRHLESFDAEALAQSSWIVRPIRWIKQAAALSRSHRRQGTVRVRLVRPVDGLPFAIPTLVYEEHIQPVQYMEDEGQGGGYAEREMRPLSGQDVWKNSATHLIDNAPWAAELHWDQDFITFLKDQGMADVLQRVEDLVTWKKMQPDRLVGQRTAIIDLPRPVVYRGQRMVAIQIKGPGYRETLTSEFGPPRLDQVYAGPGQTEFFESYDKDGVLSREPFHPRPTGTMLVKQSLVAMRGGNMIIERGLHAAVPLGFGKYLGKQFQGEDVGPAIFSIPDKESKRLDDFLHEESLKHTVGEEALAQGWYGDRYDFPNVMEALIAYGRELRKLHDQGLAHKFCTFSNVYWDPINKEIVFHDLDTVLEMSEMTDQQRVAYRLHDLNLAYMDARQIWNWFYYGKNSVFLHENLKDFDFEEAFLEGYFFDRTDAELKAIKGDIYRMFEEVIKDGRSVWQSRTKAGQILRRLVQTPPNSTEMVEPKLGSLRKCQTVKEALRLLRTVEYRFVGDRSEYVEAIVTRAGDAFERLRDLPALKPGDILYFSPPLKAAQFRPPLLVFQKTDAVNPRYVTLNFESGFNPFGYGKQRRLKRTFHFEPSDLRRLVLSGNVSILRHDSLNASQPGSAKNPKRNRHFPRGGAACLLGVIAFSNFISGLAVIGVVAIGVLAHAGRAQFMSLRTSPADEDSATALLMIQSPTIPKNPVVERLGAPDSNKLARQLLIDWVTFQINGINSDIGRIFEGHTPNRGKNLWSDQPLVAEFLSGLRVERYGNYLAGVDYVNSFDRTIPMLVFPSQGQNEKPGVTYSEQGYGVYAVQNPSGQGLRQDALVVSTPAGRFLLEKTSSSPVRFRVTALPVDSGTEAFYHRMAVTEPRRVIEQMGALLPRSWGPEVLLRAFYECPDEAMRLMTQGTEAQARAVRKMLEKTEDFRMKPLLDIADSRYPQAVKIRVALVVEIFLPTTIEYSAEELGAGDPTLIARLKKGRMDVALAARLVENEKRYLNLLQWIIDQGESGRPPMGFTSIRAYLGAHGLLPGRVDLSLPTDHRLQLAS
jgi:hypothetical protein